MYIKYIKTIIKSNYFNCLHLMQYRNSVTEKNQAISGFIFALTIEYCACIFNV